MIETNIYANVFYAIASLALITIATAVVFIVKETLPLIRNLHIISEKIQKTGTLLIEDIEDMKASAGRIIKPLLKLINFTKTKK